MRGLRLVPLAAALLAAAPVLAGWQGFYTPTERARPAGMAVAEDAVCVREILKAQLRHAIPDNLLLGIGLQEAGVRREGELTVWPWAVNAAGEGRLFDNREAAMDWVLRRQSEGVSSIDVGCMQVNLRWHPGAFDALAAGFDPAQNVDYAARFLKDLYHRTGDWETAAGSYHSFTPEKRETYLASLRRNVAAANARIDGFRALAANARPRDGGDGGTVTGQAGDSGPGFFWSAGLSQLKQGEGGVRSLYSDRELRPVLPHFRKAE